MVERGEGSMNPICILIIFAFMTSAIGIEPMEITGKSDLISHNSMNISDNAVLLCEYPSVNNTTKIVCGGEGISIKGLGEFSDRIETGNMLILVDWLNHELHISRNLGYLTDKPERNESLFKIDGKNLRILEPESCAQNANSGGIICSINFTSRKISFFDAFPAR